MDWLDGFLYDARYSKENQTILNFIGPLGDICDTPIFLKSLIQQNLLDFNI